MLQDISTSGGHPFIVSLHFAFQDVGHLYLVLDFVGGGDLFTLLEVKQQLPEHWVQVYAGEIVLALLHVHRLGIIFRDLKPENVMVEMDAPNPSPAPGPDPSPSPNPDPDPNPSPNPNPNPIPSQVEMDGHLKLTDFGLAKLKQRNSVTRASICGTPEHLTLTLHPNPTP